MPAEGVIRRRPQKQKDRRGGRQWHGNPQDWSTPAPASLDDLDLMRDGSRGERFGNRRHGTATERTRSNVRQRTTPPVGVEGSVGQRRHGVFIQAVGLGDGGLARVEKLSQVIETVEIAHILPDMGRPTPFRVLSRVRITARARYTWL